MKRKLLLVMAFVASIFAANAQTWTGNEVAEGTFYLYNVGAQQFHSCVPAGWGTQAGLQDAPGLDVKLEANGAGYSINTQISNGGTNYYLNGTWNDGGAQAWTFTKVSDSPIAYTINNGDGNLAFDGTKGNPLAVNSETGVNAQWVLVSKSDLLAAMASATEENPMNVTFLIKDANFSRNDLRSSFWTMVASNQNLSGGANDNRCAESYRSAFTLSQTLADAPSGKYGMKAQGFYRQDGSDEENLPYFYINDSKVTFPFKSGSENSMSDASASFSNGSYTTSEVTYEYAGGGLTVGAKCEQAGLWCIWDNFQLTYYGPLTDLTAYEEGLANAVAAAQAVVEGTIPTGVYNTLVAVVEANNKTYTTIAEYEDAISAITAATEAANALVAPYATLVTEVAKAKALGIADATAEAYLDVTTAAEATANTHALMVDEYNYVVNNYTVAIDLGTWTTENAGNMTSQHWDGTSTTSYSEQAEGWSQATAWSTSYTQTITLPAGEYVFKVAGRHSQYSVITLSVTEGENVIGTVNDFPIGDTGLGINKNGVTSFDAADAAGFANNGTGRGWQWRYVPFTLTEEKAVTISVVGSNPDAIRYQWLSFCNYTVQAKPSVAAAKVAYNQAVENANAALADATYDNVAGTDRSNLQGAVDATPKETIEWYENQTTLIQNYTTTFTAGVASWNSYAKVAVAKAEADLISTDICDGLSITTPTTAAEAATAAEDQYTIRVATDQYVSNTYKYSLTSKIGDFSTWTATAKAGENDDTPQTNSNQHWSGTTRDYYEQGSNGWGSATGFTCTYTKTCTLPAGNYVIKVAARASGDVAGTIAATATSNSVVLPSVGAASKGIDTSGAANFGDGTFANGGTGFGWEWRFLPFTIAADGTEVTITIQESTTKQYNWFSLADAELLSDVDKTTKVTLEETSDMATTISDNDGELATVTLKRAIKEGFNTVCLPFDLTAVQVQALFGASSEVYEFSESSADANDVTINFYRLGAGTITANVPVLVKATAASNENVIEGVTIANAAAAKVDGANVDFVGVYAPATVATGDYFVGNGALYKSAGNTNIKAFRAYIDAKEGVEAKMFIDGLETSINAINGVEAEQGVIFNLAGQRVQKAQKGIYVINGKKVLVK